MADWFTVRGFRVFVLQYRLSSNGYLLPVPLLDARRAVQTVRARAADYKSSPTASGSSGFRPAAIWRRWLRAAVPGKPDAEDPIERVSSRPDFRSWATLDRRHLQ